MRKIRLAVVAVVIAMPVTTALPSHAAQVVVKWIKPTYVVGESISWTVTATRGDNCTQTSADPTFPLKNFNFAKLTSLPYKVSAATVGEKTFSIVCQTSGSLNFSFQVIDAPPAVTLSVTGNKESLFTTEVIVLSVTGTPSDKCAFSTTADANAKNFVLDKFGQYKYRMQAPKSEGQISYSILCGRSGKVDMISQVTPLAVASSGGASNPRHNSICRTVGDIADLSPRGKGICSPQKRSSVPIWKTITSGTPCFTDGIVVDIPNNRYPRMTCTYKNGTLVFAN